MHRIIKPRTGKYRTATGQTGADAYACELAAIANARRELDRQMSTLMDIITEELPEEATSSVSMASERFPDYRRPVEREGIVKMLDMTRNSDSWSTEYALELITHLTPRS